MALPLYERKRRFNVAGHQAELRKILFRVEENQNGVPSKSQLARIEKLKSLIGEANQHAVEEEARDSESEDEST